MRILILGGTRFVGVHLVESALARGHEVTLFHRGRSNPDLFPDLEHVHGDRAHDLGALQGRRWDAVLDTSGYVPADVRAAAEALREAQHYTFISSISVYEQPMRPGAEEGAPLARLEDPATETVTPETYGPLKALSEDALLEVFGDRALIARAGLIVGPRDPTGRFSYWVRRIAAGGDVLAPGRPDRQVQLIDARDLAAWILEMVEGTIGGIFNATGPAAPLTMEALLTAIRDTLRSDAVLNWVPEDFLIQHGVAPWSHLPLWLPDGQNSLFEVSPAKALSAGLTFRPLSSTIRDVAGAAAEPPAGTAGGPGETLQPAREAELLREWMSRGG